MTPSACSHFCCSGGLGVRHFIVPRRPSFFRSTGCEARRCTVETGIRQFGQRRPGCEQDRNRKLHTFLRHAQSGSWHPQFRVMGLPHLKEQLPDAAAIVGMSNTTFRVWTHKGQPTK